MFIHVWFSELSVMYDIFFHVRAVDADQGNNAAIRYAIIGGNTQGQFSIDSVSGEVSLVKPLDYETLRSYRLVIRAQGKLPEWNWWHLVTIFGTYCLWIMHFSSCEWSNYIHLHATALNTQFVDLLFKRECQNYSCMMFGIYFLWKEILHVIITLLGVGE